MRPGPTHSAQLTSCNFSVPQRASLVNMTCPKVLSFQQILINLHMLGAIFIKGEEGGESVPPVHHKLPLCILSPVDQRCTKKMTTPLLFFPLMLTDSTKWPDKSSILGFLTTSSHMGKQKKHKCNENIFPYAYQKVESQIGTPATIAQSNDADITNKKWGDRSIIIFLSKHHKSEHRFWFWNTQMPALASQRLADMASSRLATQRPNFTCISINSPTKKPLQVFFCQDNQAKNLWFWVSPSLWLFVPN